MSHRLIDTHCHLAHGKLYPRIDEVLHEACAAGVVACVAAAGDLHETRTARNLAREHEGVWFLAGVHPHDAAEAPQGYLAEIEQHAEDARNAGIGEIGLDYHYDYSPRDVQRRVFAEQLDLAARLARPVVIHSRQAHQDVMAILGDSDVEPARVLFHSCTAEPAQMRQILDYGAMVSFSGIVTFKKSEPLRASARMVPDDRLLVETDAPFLSPEPLRKVHPNAPAMVTHVAACLARHRGVPLDLFAQQTTTNAIRFFGVALDGADCR